MEDHRSRHLVLRLLVAAIPYSVLTATGLVYPRLGLVIVLGLVFVALTLYAYHEWVLPLTIGVRCPSCGTRALRRLARHPGYHECSDCGHRYKRANFGDPWMDASGPEDAPKYSRR